MPQRLRGNGVELRTEARLHRPSEQRVFGVGQPVGPLAGALGQLRVLGQPGHPELRHAVLASAEYLAGTPQTEVDLRERETVALGRDRLEARQRRVPEQDADGLVLPPAHAAAQLME